MLAGTVSTKSRHSCRFVFLSKTALIALLLNAPDASIFARPAIENEAAEMEALNPAIHATRLDYSEFDSPESVTVITQEDIRLAGYLEVSDIFRSVPGFRIVKIGDESRLSYHGTTSRANRRMLVTVDGHTALIGEGQYVEFDRLPVDLEDISRVTVVRGPNGAAYGDNAFLASISFETIGRNDPRGISIRTGGGYNDRRKAVAAVNEQFGDYNFAFSTAWERDGGYDYYDKSGTPRDDGKEIKRARLAIERDFTDRSRWRLDSSAYRSENQTGIRMLSFTGDQRNQGEFVALSNDWDLGESSRIDWSVNHYRTQEEMRQFACYTPESIARTTASISDPRVLAEMLLPTLFVPQILGATLANTCTYTDLDSESTRNGIEAEFESTHGPWRYLLGGSLTRVNAASEQYFAGAGQTQRTKRAFSEAAVSLGSVHTSLGVMLQDSNNVENAQVAWRGAVNWQFRPNQVLRYSYADSFRIPSLLETETFWTSRFYFGVRGQPLSSYKFFIPLPLVTRDTRLHPEKIESHSLGYFGAFFGSTATLDVKIFNDQIHDPVQANIFYFFPPPSNGQGFNLRGAEAEASLRIGERWKFSGHLSYLHTDAPRIESGLHGDYAGSFAVTLRPVPGHAVTASYYGNSTISGNSYDRYDLVYGYDRSIGTALVRSQLVFQHHVGGADGLRDAVALTSNEGYFAHLNQFFVYLEVVF